jgi:radical SAM superfamily enzyme YgiQ (UPF0313 family)
MEMYDIIFVVPSFIPNLRHESIGTLILAQKAIDNHFKVGIVRFWEGFSENFNFSDFCSKIIEIVSAKKTKTVSFYCRDAEYHIIMILAKKIKALFPNINIVLGGPQAELSAETTLSTFHFIDYICCGEGENTIVPLLKYLQISERKTDNIKSIYGLVYRDDKGDIVKNPLPSMLPDNYINDSRYYGLIPETVFKKSRVAGIDVGRGCPYACSFCSTKTFWKRKFRLRDLNDTIQEIEYVINKYNINSFAFEHDLFTANKRRLMEFCKLLREKQLNISWTCSSRVDTIDNEMIDEMVSVGLAEIFYGVESGSNTIQHLIKKNLNLEKASNIIKYTRSKGVNVTASFIYGFPNENEDDINKTLEMMWELSLLGVDTQLHRLQIENGTELFEKYKLKLKQIDPSVLTDTIGLSESIHFVEKHPEIFPNYFDFDSDVRKRMMYLQTFFNVASSHKDIYNDIFKKTKMSGGRYIDVYTSFYKRCRFLLERYHNNSIAFINELSRVFLSLEN